MDLVCCLPLLDIDQKNVCCTQIFVLDEADRILDLGFKSQLDSILHYLPPAGSDSRQTLLFSATQTKKVKDLARLSLNEPEYVSVHEKAEFVTPPALAQRYVVVEPHNKINTLWAFIKTHLKHKVLVFFATCKQAKFVDGLFRQLRPGQCIGSSMLVLQSRGFWCHGFDLLRTGTGFLPSFRETPAFACICICICISTWRLLCSLFWYYLGVVGALFAIFLSFICYLLLEIE